eukprot:TRINITY_DN22387_c0_g1_i2.p2 TRINITY_DN22387_c0_g1~~TRINITY_DN22387_c0_g1_i2.p2  ORF type:complete len:133 (+),score=27.86 TRINITY_DN22387_c0_g1_i2:147-545(+)
MCIRDRNDAGAAMPLLPPTEQPKAEKRSPKHGPPCKYRLLLIVWLCAVLTSIVIGYSIVPFFKEQLMDLVGPEAFMPAFSGVIISMVMPLVFMIWVPICVTWLCPIWVRVRPERDAFPDSSLGNFLFWFLVG